MYKKMLVPLDGSQMSKALLTYAKELANKLDMDVSLLHLYSSEEQESASMRRIYIERAADSIRDQLGEAREKINARIPDVRGEIIEGYAAEGILRYAEENDVDLILISTHGRSGVRPLEWAFGSVAEKVLRRSKVPVWLVRAGVTEEAIYKRWPKRTVLVPLDGSELAEQVLPHVEALAIKWGADLMNITLFVVSESMLLPSYYPLEWPLSWDDHLVKSKKINEEYAARIEKRLRAAGLTVHSEVVAGKAADQIVDYTERRKCDLIALTTHGRSGLSRWAYGSVSEKVMRRVTSQVLLVRSS